MFSIPRSLVAALVAASVGVACADSAITAPARPVQTAAAHRDDSCNPEVAFVACNDPGYSAPMPQNQGYQLGISMSGCMGPAAWDDVDRDSLSDNCELILATAFAPKMMMNVQFINLNSALNQGATWPGEYYWGATPVTVGFDTRRIRLAYMPAYYHDWGHGLFDSGHNGDSEFIMIDVEYVPEHNSFEMRDAFLSAHCGAFLATFETDPDCQWWGTSYWDNASGFVDTPLGAPVVWVANGTNANYFGQHKCNTGSNWFDDCYGLYDGARFPITPGFNVGSYRGHMLPDWIYARRYPTLGQSDKVESFWPGHGFAGWQGGVGETSYAAILARFGFGGPVSTGTICNPDPAAIYCG